MNHFKSQWNRTPKGLKILGVAVVSIVAITIMGFVLGTVIMLLWNWLMPEIFNLKEISYWQAVGLFFLAKILFGIGGNGEKKSQNTERVLKQYDTDNDRKESTEEIKNWKFYDEWWESEGKINFEDYVTKRNECNTDSTDNTNNT